MARDESKNDPDRKPLFDELQTLAAPLFAAGWKLVATDTDERLEFGDSAFYDLERGSVCIELEYYEHGQLVANRDAQPTNIDGKPPEPYFVLSEVHLADFVGAQD